MPLPRFYKLPEEEQRLLLEVATRELAAHGYEGASLNRIIAAAKISKGAMYYYFSDKAELYLAVVEQAVARLASEIGPLPDVESAEGFWDAVVCLFDRANQALLAEPLYAALGRAVYEHPGGVLEPLYQRARAQLSAWLERGQRVGGIREDVPLEFLATALFGMLSALDRWFVAHWERLDPDSLQALSEKTIGLCYDLAAPR